MGIEPTSEAWEASILPLYDARSALFSLIIHKSAFPRTARYFLYFEGFAAGPRRLDLRRRLIFGSA